MTNYKIFDSLFALDVTVPNFMENIIAGLITYSFPEKKLAIKSYKNEE